MVRFVVRNSRKTRQPDFRKTDCIKGQGMLKKSQKQRGKIVMARHGENIRKRKDGRWEGRYPVYNAEKQKKVYCSVYGRSYEEVREKLFLHKSPEKQYGGGTNRKILLNDVAREWLMEVKVKRKPSTYVKYSMVFQKHIEKAFLGRMLLELTDTLVKETLSDHLSDNMRKSIYCVLNQVLKYAFRQYSIAMPCLNKPELEMKNKPIQTFIKKDQQKLVATLCHETDLFKMAVLLCLFTGLRLGELCALKWSDIDFDNKTLVVSRTVQRLHVDGHKTKTILMETVPKSAYSCREIPLSDTILKMLIRFRGNDEYVFGKNKPLEPRNLQYHFKKILREANLPDTNFHILRHTFATNCIEGGTDVKSLSEMLGHSDVEITLNRYVHPSMDTKRQCVDSLSKVYGHIYGHAG